MRALEALEADEILRMQHAVSLAMPRPKKQRGEVQSAINSLRRRIDDMTNPDKRGMRDVLDGLRRMST